MYRVPRKVQGSATQAKPLIIGKDTVYVHENIVPVKDEEGKVIEDLFEYDEIQYGKDEYIAFISNKQSISIMDSDSLAEALIEVTLELDSIKSMLKQGGQN